MGSAEVAVERVDDGFQLHLVDFDRVGETSRPSPNTYIEMPTGYLNVFGQQRTRRNEQQGALTDSLEEGQIHAISVVMASPELIEEYRQFTNKTWGKDVQSASLRPMPEADPYYPGMYAILCAGHSRTDGIREIASRAGVNPDTALIEARVFEVTSIEEILRIQISENIHSQPSPDSGLRATAEMFLFQTAKNHGVPPEKASFRRRYKMSEQTLNDAINYVQLPPYIRALTDDDGMPFGILKEFARARQVIEDYANYLADRDPRFAVAPGATADERAGIATAREAAIEGQIKTELFSLLKGVHERGAGAGKNILAARTFIKGRAKMVRDRLAGRQAADLEMRFELFEDPETLASRLEHYQKEVRDYLGLILSEQQLRQDHLARRLGRMTGLDVEEEDPAAVVAAIEEVLALARAAIPAATA